LPESVCACLELVHAVNTMRGPRICSHECSAASARSMPSPIALLALARISKLLSPSARATDDYLSTIGSTPMVKLSKLGRAAYALYAG
jgi:hypothetical protein